MCRERAVLTRQLQEAKMALADVKTSWSGQIASLETQVDNNYTSQTILLETSASTLCTFKRVVIIIIIISLT